jgi:hypothetical protein
MKALLALILLAAPVSQDPRDVSEVPRQYVGGDRAWRPAELLCGSAKEVIAVGGGRLTRVSRQDGAKLEDVRVEEKEVEENCGLGSCSRQSTLQREGEPPLAFSGRRSNYYGDWAWGGTLGDAQCPGGRPVAVCLTARREISIQVVGDPNTEDEGNSLTYVAADARTRGEPFRVEGGKVERAGPGEEYAVSFRNQGWTYRLQVSAGAAPAASLRVERGGKVVQTEPCVAFGVWPEHLKLFAARAGSK